MFGRLKIELEDKIRYNRRARSVLSFINAALVNTNAWSPQEIARTIEKLCKAARLAVSIEQQTAIENEIKVLIKRLNRKNIDWREFEPTAEKRLIESAAVLKPYLGDKEKGVVYLSFEYQWTRLLQNCDIKEFASQYRLVLAPVWAVPYSLVNFLLPELWEDDVVFTHLSDPNDAAILPRISSKYVIAPLLCSSWVNPEWFKPLPFEKKDIDLVMLANFGKYKRHFVLFKALREMPQNLRILLIGQRNGNRTRDVLLNEARLYGVENRFELLEGPADTAVFDALARSKASVILSLREGSCVAVTESLFADTPVALFKDAEVGSRIFINDNTGIFLEHSEVGRQLTDFINSAGNFTPRQWAMENKIHCFESSSILNRVIRDHCKKIGEEWSQDIATFHWRPYPAPVFENDRKRLQQERRRIKEKFGLIIGKEPLD
ncbi:MAG: glycosyltransferase [Verrucomicrobiia bacterium]